MPGPNHIAPDKLVRLLGLPSQPVVVDLRTDAQFAADPRFVPGSVRRSAQGGLDWAKSLDRTPVLLCEDGHAVSQGAAALLRAEGIAAEVLDGGHRAWGDAGLPLVPEAALPPRDGRGRTRWVTRARPKVDRIACPWLIRRFVDRDALILFTPPGDVVAVAGALEAAPFDLDAAGVHWTHRGDDCTFDLMVDGFGLAGFEALDHLRLVVRAADTGRPDLVPEAAGLLAVSLGLSRMFTDDDRQLNAGMTLYDALYRWCRDARAETHGWDSHQPRAGARS